MSFEKRILELGLNLPDAPKAIASYIPAQKSGNLLFTSGQLPVRNGEMLSKGPIRAGMDLNPAFEASKQACLNALSAAKALLGTLDKVEKVLKMNVFVASEPSFTEQHLVANSASELLQLIFGEDGRHARAAVGVSSLPLNASLELELILLLK
ncbi:MAG: RidA family protein [Leptospiraceae bacterium]|nr:RidA family protein [Leptospiraceae bacterium]MCP5499435.1 RidA family protein [Leptospiraceae bacterium]